jgi:hypothetical protein
VDAHHRFAAASVVERIEQVYRGLLLREPLDERRRTIDDRRWTTDDGARSASRVVARAGRAAARRGRPRASVGDLTRHWRSTA